MVPPRCPPKPRPGDRVAVLSPSAGLPAIFPAVSGSGLRRLREDLGLEPVEYPTTRVLAPVGGDDLITVTPHLDETVIAALALGSRSAQHL